MGGRPAGRFPPVDDDAGRTSCLGVNTALTIELGRATSSTSCRMPGVTFCLNLVGGVFFGPCGSGGPDGSGAPINGTSDPVELGLIGGLPLPRTAGTGLALIGTRPVLAALVGGVRTCLPA